MLDALAAAAEALLYTGILSCSGAVFAATTLNAPPGITAYLNKIVRRGALLTIFASMAGALVLLYRLGGQIETATLAAVFLSNAGGSMGIQLFGSMLMLTTIGNDPFARRMRLVNSVVLVLSFAFNGHAPEAGPRETIAALFHVSAAAWWIGSLWLLHFTCRTAPESDLTEAVILFSSRALQTVVVLVLAGMIIAMFLVSYGVTPLISPYLKVLAVKIFLVIMTLCIAAYNRYRLTPRITRGDGSAAQMLSHTIRIEMILIAAVLITTSILTTYTSPYENGAGVSYF